MPQQEVGEAMAEQVELRLPLAAGKEESGTPRRCPSVLLEITFAGPECLDNFEGEQGLIYFGS